MGKGRSATRRQVLLDAGGGAAAVALLLGLGGGAAAARHTARSPAPAAARAARPRAGVAQVDVSAFATQPVVLTGQDFPSWSSGPEITARAPQAPNDYGVYNSQANQPKNLQSDCYQSNPQPDNNGSTDANHNDHNC